MKNKRSAFIPSILAATAVMGLLHAAPPEGAPPSPEVVAKQKVAVEIFAKMNPVTRPFSRVAPVPTHSLEFQPQQLVNGESRLHFVIRPRGVADNKLPAAPAAQGYVRLSDQQIFLLDAKTGDFQPAQNPPPQPVTAAPANPA